MKPMTCREALLLLLDQVDFTAGACSLTDMVGQCVPKGVFETCREAIAAEKPLPEVVPHERGALIERVARALCRHAHADRDESERVSPTGELWQRFISEAKVALQALPSPLAAKDKP